MRISRYLVVDAMTGNARTVKRRPKPAFGELVYRLNIEIPERWSQVMGDIDLTLPDPPEDAVVVEEYE